MNRQRDILDKLIDVTASGAFWIEFFVVVSGSVQWFIASISADGFSVPQSWTWIHILSGISGLAMAVIEGFAIAFVFGALGKNKNKFLAVLAFLMSVSLVLVIAPSTYARASNESIADILPSSYVWMWSISFIASRMLTVASVAWADSLGSNNDLQSVVASAIEKARNALVTEYENRIEQLTHTLNGEKLELQNQLVIASNEQERTLQHNNELQNALQELNKQMEQLEQELEKAQTTISVQYEDDKMDNRDRLIALYKNAPELSMTVAGNIVGVSRQYVSQLLSEFEQDGKVKINRNGNDRIKSVEVL